MPRSPHVLAPAPRRLAALASLGATLAASLLGGACDLNLGAPWSASDPELAVADRPVQLPGDGYVGSSACRACHPGEYATWHDSYHRRMTQVVTGETAAAPFDGRELAWRGATYRVAEREGRPVVQVPDPDWDGEPGAAPLVERPVVLSTGSHHAQAYWYPYGATRRLSLFPFCWRVPEERWVPIDAVFLFPPNQSQANGQPRWNTTCNKCHATRSEPRLFGEEDMDTRVAEFGIACEACHGPGGEHVAANHDPRARYARHASGDPDPTIVQPEHLPPRERAMVCGQCHGITMPRGPEGQREWAVSGFSFRPGEDLLASRDLVPTGSTYFWDDGVPRVSGREYMGLVRSPCYASGEGERAMTCLACHDLHQDPDDRRDVDAWRDDQLAPGMRGDEGCLQCHEDYRDAGRRAAHTHHPAGSTGSSCYDCHMTYTTWGLLKAIRTHEVRSPDARETLEVGRPNACNLCHLDRTLGWTAERLEAWYGIPAPAIPAARRGVAESVRGLLTGDAGQRALYAWALGWAPAQEASGTEWMAPLLAQLLVDPYHAVRFRAHRSLTTLPGFEDFAYDYVGSPADRRAALDRAYGLWLAGTHPGGRERPGEVLLDERGELVREPFQRLLSRRDDRPVMLEE